MKTDLNKSVIYQIYLRTFTAEGTLKAAEALIPHLYEMGIDIIYMSACNKEDSAIEGQSARQKASGMNNPKNPYRISDYFSVDEEYGTIDDLYDFISTAHEYGIKVLLDLVFFHCGPNAVFLKAHPEFVRRDDNGDILVGEFWPFAVFNYEVPALREYLWSIMEFYVNDMHADGFRCDASDLVPLDFWEEGIRRIRAINPDVIMINEGSNIDFLKEFNIDYNFYALNDLFLDTNDIEKGNVTDGKEPMTVKEFKNRFDATYMGIPADRFHLLYSENHDTVSDLAERRPEILLGSDAAEAILTLIFTLRGVPMLYNGCEVADNTLKNMFWNRFSPGSMSVQWQNALCEKGKNRLNFIKKLVRLHRHNVSLCYGNLEWCDDISNDNVLAFTRENCGKSVTVIVNVGQSTQSITVPHIKDNKIVIAKNVNINNSAVSLNSYGVLIFEKQNSMNDLQ